MDRKADLVPGLARAHELLIKFHVELVEDLSSLETEELVDRVSQGRAVIEFGKRLIEAVRQERKES